MQKVGIVGLGNIGGPVAVNLLAAGFKVLGYDLRRKPNFDSAGGEFAESIEAIPETVDIIIHSLPNEAALIGSVDAILGVGRPGITVLDMSSYALKVKMEQSRRLSAAGCFMVDCEVSGLPQHVAARKAVLFKSGDPAVIERLNPVFDAISERHFNLGPFGCATKMKLIANTMVCVHNLMAAEALNLGTKAGLDPKQMVEVLTPSAAGSATFANKSPLMLSRNFAGGAGPFRHMFGYLKRTDEMANDVNAKTPLLELARRWYDMAEEEGRHNEDIAAMIEILEGRAAVTKDRNSGVRELR